MLLRLAVVLLGGSYVAFRLATAWQIRQARRAGDVERERVLRAREAGLYRWVAGIVVVAGLLLALLVVLNSRQ